MEFLNGVPHVIFPIEGNGNCLFASLGYAVYGEACRGMDVRALIVNHVAENWKRFKDLTYAVDGHNHANALEYINDMSRKETYGTTCELHAAGEIFHYQFEIWRNGALYCCFGNEANPIRRLRFSGNLAGGHFDVYVPLSPTPHLSIYSKEPKTQTLPELRSPKRKQSKRSQCLKGRNRKKVYLSPVKIEQLDGVPHVIVPIEGNGNCLFASLGHVVYGAACRGMDVRALIVNHVVENWNRFKDLTYAVNGHNHTNAVEYRNDMSRKETYGTACELHAAGEIFHYQFEIWRNGALYCCFGNEANPVRRFRFSGNLAGGHFDVYVPLSPTPQLYIDSPEQNTQNLPNLKLPKRKQSKRTQCLKDRNRKKVNLSPEKTTQLDNDNKREKIMVTDVRRPRFSGNFDVYVPLSLSPQISPEPNTQNLPNLRIPKRKQSKRSQCLKDRNRTKVYLSPENITQLDNDNIRDKIMVNDVRRPRFSGNFDIYVPLSPTPQLSPEQNTQNLQNLRIHERKQSKRSQCLKNRNRKKVYLSPEKITQLDNDNKRDKIMVNDEENEANKVINLSNTKLPKRTESERSRRLKRRNQNRVYVSQAKDIKRIRLDKSNEKINNQGQQIISKTREETILEFYCGAMTFECLFCKAKHFAGERPQDKRFRQCCQKGKVDLTTFAPKAYPSILKDLLIGKHVESKNFITHIRSFNSAFSFASLGAQVKAPPGYGPYCFRIHGQIYHRALTLHPAPGETRKYAQLYILDPEEATYQRMNIPGNTECSNSVMKALSSFFNTNNPLAKAHKMLYEVEKEAEADAKRRGVAPAVVTMAIKQDRSLDKRRYNAPRANEVAVIFQSTDGTPPFQRDLLIHLRPEPSTANQTYTKRISFLHPSLEPMTYPIFFPFGEPGWHPDIAFKESAAKGKRTRVSQMAYYSYRIAVREGFNQFLSAGKLTQQYFVDSYVKMESNRLRWIKEHQKELRVESYQGLMDFLHSRAAEEGLAAGKPIILPSSFIGSPRNMQQNYQDAMTIVRKFGKPDIFLTMTCNPKWREITENMESYQTDRPDLVARVFHLKLSELITDICKRHILGKVIAKIHVIEFQKRGLPHAHMLIMLSDIDKPRDRDAIDEIVSAEIPNPEDSPRLHDIVLKHMVHGPCGLANINSPCMENGQCSKGFPKSFQEETICNLDGYPRYQRRNTNKTYKTKAGFELTNQWIVPYNPYLSLKYNCHINVEVCASVKSVKYLFKYVYKGYDCANVEIREHGNLTHDEIKTFVDARYVSAPEAAWRILGKPMHDQSHSIIRLAVHLPNYQTVVFRHDNVQQMVSNMTLSDSTLMAWFQLNQNNINARKLYYSEIPEHYVFSKKNGWQKRKKVGSCVIGRMYTVSVSEGERYFLRLLLLHIAGATGFQDLKTINGITYPSFKEAAKSFGLLQDDSVWESTIEEAAAMSMPFALRQLFAYICVFGSPLETRKIWDKFLEHFVEDFARHHEGHKNGCSTCENIALQQVQNILALHGKTCREFGLKTPPANLPKDNFDVFNVEKEKAEGCKLQSSLNSEQDHVFQTVMNAIYVQRNSSNCFFLDGPGGSGKTYLYKVFLSVIRGKGDIVLPVASTGIAANLLNGGRTYHSQFKLPVPLTEISTSNMRTNSLDAQQIKKAKLIIWDEATMAPSHALNAVDKLLKTLMNNSKPFGGKVLLLGGDFRQCLPVVPHAHRAAIVQSSLKYSVLWSEFKILPLKTNIRAADVSYRDWLLKMGDGDLNSEFGDDIIKIPSEMLAQNSIVIDIYGKKLKPSQIENYSQSAILCPRNEEVCQINEQVLNILEGELFTYLSIDSVECDIIEEGQNYPIEFLNSLTPSGLPPHKLNLKVGSIVMLLRNLNTRKGLCNGTRLQVTKLSQNLICATILTGTAAGNPAFIPRIDLAPINPDLPFILRRRQFPIRLAFSITINKSQGQTLKKVGIFLPKPIFSHGQMYVAFSRVRASEDIKVEVVHEDGKQGMLRKGSMDVFSKNIVYKEIF